MPPASRPCAPPYAQARCGERVKQLALGSGGGCVLLLNGTVRCWGAAVGQEPAESCGPPHRCRVPLEVPGVAGAVSLAVGAGRACAVLERGDVTCWGRGLELQPGERAPRWRGPTPAEWIRGSREVTFGRDHACALHGSGSVECWGRNEYGQLGDATTEDGRTSAQFTPNSAEVDASWHRTCARTRQGEVWCWGEDTMGSLGSPVTEQCADRTVRHLRPCNPKASRVAGLEGAVSLALGQEFGCAALKDGRVACWGSGNHGELGFPEPAECTEVQESLRAPPGSARGNRDVWRRGPCSRRARVVPGVRDAVQVEASRDQACVRHRDGTVACWGYNHEEWLGVPSGVTCPSNGPCAAPTLVPGLTDVVQLAMGEGFSSGPTVCALRGSGDVLCWGVAPVGDGTDANRRRPTPLHFASTAPAPARLSPVARGPACLAQRGGCPAAPEPPRCTLQQRELTVDKVLGQAAALEGKQVAVRGALVRQGGASCTLMGCPPGTCCNECTSGVAIGGGPDSDASLPLENFACKGDESLQCCGFPVHRQTVVASGWLEGHDERQERDGRLVTLRRYGLRSASLCTP